MSSGFRSAPRLKLYLMSVCQMPERSTVPDAVRGGGAFRSTLPSLSRCAGIAVAPLRAHGAGERDEYDEGRESRIGTRGAGCPRFVRRLLSAAAGSRPASRAIV